MYSLPSYCYLFLFTGNFLAVASAASDSSASSAVLPLIADDFGTSHAVEIKVGEQALNVTVDTGSANLWIVETGYHCYNVSSTAVFGPQVNTAECGFSPNTFKPSSTFKPVDGDWMGIYYASGNIIGPAGEDTVSIGGVSIPQQLLGVANGTTVGLGGPIITGLMGLAWPAASFIHPADFTVNSSVELWNERWAYDTVAINAAKNAAQPYFALAIERTPLGQEGGFGGYISFGTLPPVPHGDFATVPAEVTKSIPAPLKNGTSDLTFWTTTVQSTVWGDKTDDTSYQVIIDSGTPVLALPSSIASKINAQFDPPGMPMLANGPLTGAVAVQCNATAPSGVGFEIGGQTFYIEPSDLIWTDGGGVCMSAVSAAVSNGGAEEVILGDILFKNAVIVFDVGKKEMRFAARKASSSSGAVATGMATNYQAELIWLTLGAVFTSIMVLL